MWISELETPAVIVDLDALEANINKLQTYLDTHGLEGWPHVKTHKIPEIAYMQMKAGAAGVTCQKLGEAEVMAEAGIQHLFIPYNIIGDAKLDRLMSLTAHTRVAVTADSEFVVLGLSKAARRKGTVLEVLVEFDSGLRRCGVRTPQEAKDLAVIISQSANLRFGGLMTYPNTENLDPFVREARRLLNSHGIDVERVSGGGTPCMWQAHTHRELTEHRAGTYVFGDRCTVKSGAMQVEDCSLRVLTTVVSRPEAALGILDGGTKTFSSDILQLEGYGIIMEYPEAHFSRMSEEHGHVDFSQSERKPEIGERVTVLPNHCCTVINLFDEIVGVRQDRIEVIWQVAARGKVQ